MNGRKLFEPGNEGPDLQLVTRTHEGNPYRYVYLYEDGIPVATAELHPVLGVQSAEGFEGDGPLAEWAGSWSHRRHHQHRLVATVEDDALVVAHERRTDSKSMYVGDEREEGDWLRSAGWRITADGVRELPTEEATP